MYIYIYIHICVCFFTFTVVCICPMQYCDDGWWYCCRRGVACALFVSAMIDAGIGRESNWSKCSFRLIACLCLTVGISGEEFAAAAADILRVNNNGMLRGRWAVIDARVQRVKRRREHEGRNDEVYSTELKKIKNTTELTKSKILHNLKLFLIDSEKIKIMTWSS